MSILNTDNLAFYNFYLESDVNFKLFCRKTRRIFTFLVLRNRNLYRHLEMEFVDRFWYYRYLLNIILLYTVEGQVSRTDERYLFNYERLLNKCWKETKIVWWKLETSLWISVYWFILWSYGWFFPLTMRRICN